MATERQIAANRRNAAKSTGPRSAAGKKRAGRNAYRHGLSLTAIPSFPLNKQLEERALAIGDTSQDPARLALARAVAEAELELGRVRWAKVLLIRSVSAAEGVDPAQITHLGRLRRLQPALVLSAAQDAIPGREPERSAEAFTRSLPQLWRLDRYERRAAARRDRAARALLADLNKKDRNA